MRVEIVKKPKGLNSSYKKKKKIFWEEKDIGPQAHISNYALVHL